MIDLWVTHSLTDNHTESFLFSKWYFMSQGGALLFFTFFHYYLANYNYNLFAGKKNITAYITPLVIAILVLIVYYSIDEILLPHNGIVRRRVTSSILKKTNTSLLVIARSISVFFLLGSNLLSAYLFYLRDEKKQRKILEAQKLQLEVEKSSANYNFLKAQINPHFLHNTLNFLYAKSLPFSPELSEGILTLSEIMRYALGEHNLTNGKAALKDEIEHLRNVIKIHQLRFGNSLQVHFEVNGIVNGAAIIPLVLITIVENAFKHGNLKSAEHPIEIKLNIAHNSLHFYCRNKKKTGPKELSTGIGLNNIKKRLNLAYGEQYTFTIKDEAEFYTSQLTIYSV